MGWVCKNCNKEFSDMFLARAHENEMEKKFNVWEKTHSYLTVTLYLQKQHEMLHTVIDS